MFESDFIDFKDIDVSDSTFLARYESHRFELLFFDLLIDEVLYWQKLKLIRAFFFRTWNQKVSIVDFDPWIWVIWQELKSRNTICLINKV